MFYFTSAECWSGPVVGADKKTLSNELVDAYKKHGVGEGMCIDSNYKNFEGEKTSCATYAGKQSANFVYRITPLVARKYFPVVLNRVKKTAASADLEVQLIQFIQEVDLEG